MQSLEYWKSEETAVLTSHLPHFVVRWYLIFQVYEVRRAALGTGHFSATGMIFEDLMNIIRRLRPMGNISQQELLTTSSWVCSRDKKYTASTKRESHLDTKHLMLRLIACCVAMPLVYAGEDSQPQPNIVLIFCDDLGYADVGFNAQHFGVETDVVTPNLDALAKKGTIFRQAYA